MFAVLGLGEALARVIAFVGTAYIANALGAESFGIFALASAIVLYFAQVANFSVEMLGAREIAKAVVGIVARGESTTPERTAVNRLVPPLLLARLALSAVCIAALALVGWLFFPSPDGAVLAITSLGLLAVAVSTRFVFIGIERPLAPAVSNVVAELLGLGLILMFVHSAQDVKTAPLIKVFGDTAATLLMLVVLRMSGFSLPWRYDTHTVKPVFRAATPLVFNAILGLAIFNSDLIFLRALHDARTVGIYAAAYTLISFLLNLGVTYGTSILPALSRELQDRVRMRALYQQAMMQVLTLGLPIAAGGALLADGLLDLVFSSKYTEAVGPLQILIWSIVAAWVRNVVQMGLIARDQQAYVFRTTAWSAAANAVLNLLLIPKFGMIGAAVATLATEAIRTVVVLRYAAKLDLSFGVWSRLWRPVLGTAVMAALLVFVPFPHVIMAVIAGVVTYGAALVATGGIRLAGGKLQFNI